MTRYQRLGYEWESRFKKSVQTSLPNAFIYKLMDTHSIEGLLKKLKKTETQYNNFLVPRVPADFIVIEDGATIWVECKSTANLEHFPIKNIKSHQLEFASDIEGAGGEFVFAIQRDEPRNKQAFLLSYNTLVHIQLTLGKSKNIPWRVFETQKEVIELPRKAGSLFDMGDLVYVP